MPSLITVWAVLLSVNVTPNSNFYRVDSSAQSYSRPSQKVAQLRFGRDASAALTPSRDPIPTCQTPKIDLLPLPAGRTRIVVQSNCRKYERLRITYGGAEFIRRIDENGRLEFILDCFAGDTVPVKLVFADGQRVSKRVEAFDLDRVTKVAVLWSAPVNLDLHAFEYSALPETPDHISPTTPLSDGEARRKLRAKRRGHGFLSSYSTGMESGTKLEVYTFLHHPRQKRGVINMALDYESRAHDKRNPDTCGNGLYSELEYEAVMLKRNRAPHRLFRKFAPLDCKTRLSGINRLNHKTVPEIIIRN